MCVCLSSWCCEMWMALGADSTLALQIMEMIVEKLNVMVPYVDKKESMLRPGLTKVATSHPLAVSVNTSGAFLLVVVQQCILSC